MSDRSRVYRDAEEGRPFIVALCDQGGNGRPHHHAEPDEAHAFAMTRGELIDLRSQINLALLGAAMAGTADA